MATVVEAAPTRADAEELPTSRVAALLAAIVVVTWLPYALAGPGMLADDWSLLRNAHFDGVLGAAGGRQLGRPGAALAYDLLFGVVGPHPLVAYTIMGLLRLAVAWAVFRLLDDHVERRAAVLVVGLWLVIPTHMALEHWASTVQAWLALWLLAVATRRVLRGRHGVGEALMLAAAVLCYELVLPMAGFVAVVVPVLKAPRDWRASAAGAVAVGLAAGWLIWHPIYALTTGHLNPYAVLPAHFGLGLPAASTAAAVLSLAVVVGAGAVWWHRRGERSDVLRLLGWGTLTLVLGIAVLVGHGTQFRGYEDRLTGVSGIGAAMVVAGIVLAVPRRVGILVVAGVVALAVPIRAEKVDRYQEAADRAVEERDRLVAEVGCRTSLDIDRTLWIDEGIGGLIDGWNASAAVQVALDNPTITIRTPADSLGGPPPVEDAVSTC